VSYAYFFILVVLVYIGECIGFVGDLAFLGNCGDVILLNFSILAVSLSSEVPFS
jgi:hypothetical protein